jgi:hypothetical protein
VTLAPGMTYTASDGSTTKSLLIEAVGFDELNPFTKAAAGSGPTGRPVQVSVYWDTLSGDPNAHNVYVKDVLPEGGRWSVDVQTAGGQVDFTSRGDVFLPDDGADGNFDFTAASVFVTAVNLNVPGAAAASTLAGTAATGRTGRGKSVVVSGRLKAGDRVCTKRKRVQLVSVKRKKRSVLASSKTTKRGRFSFRHSFRRTTRVKVRFRGDALCQRSESVTKTVHR